MLDSHCLRMLVNSDSYDRDVRQLSPDIDIERRDRPLHHWSTIIMQLPITNICLYIEYIVPKIINMYIFSRYNYLLTWSISSSLSSVSTESPSFEAADEPLIRLPKSNAPIPSALRSLSVTVRSRIRSMVSRADDDDCDDSGGGDDGWLCDDKSSSSTIADQLLINFASSISGIGRPPIQHLIANVRGNHSGPNSSAALVLIDDDRCAAIDDEPERFVAARSFGSVI